MDSDSIIRIYSYSFPQINYIFDAKELFNHIKSNYNYNIPLYNVPSNQDINHSNILDRENKMLMKYESVELTIKWINDNETIPDMHDWDDFRNRYSFHHVNYTNEFNYTKKDVCKIAFFLLFTLTEILAICPCDQVFSIVFWNELNLCQPINKDCKRPKIDQRINLIRNSNRNRNDVYYSKANVVLRYVIAKSLPYVK